MFGKKRERLRQWSLLGELLRGLPLLDALDFMDAAFGPSTVDWYGIRDRAAVGKPLSAIAKDTELKTPQEVVDALEDGEEDGRLSERLAELAPPGREMKAAPVDEGVVPLVNGVLLAASVGGATGMMLQKLPGGDGQVKFYQGDAWTLHSRHPADEFADMVRRFLVMAGRSYWAPEPGVFRSRHATGTIELRVTPDGKGGLGIEVGHVS